MAKLPLRVGLTGGIACGKTTVSELFAQLGIPIIDADTIAHALVAPRQPALERIVQTFGSELRLPDGHLNRVLLRQRIFADAKQRQHLEAILHPLIFQAMQQQVNRLQGVPYCLLCIPLLLETQRMDIVERIVVVDCPTHLQRQRLMARNGFSPQEITQILSAQATKEARLAIANDVIYNDSGLDSLQQQVLKLHQQYVKQSHGSYQSFQ